jgi:DNA-binding transcriptional MerR regulator
MDTKYRKMEDVLRDLGRKIDDMIDSSELSKIEWKKEVDERFQEIRNNIDTLEEKTKDLVGDQEKWKDVEDRLRNAANDLCEAVETAFGVNRKAGK